MQNYLDLLSEIVEKGYDERKNGNQRTDTWASSLFSRTLRYDLSKGFPLDTTREIHFPSLIGEFLWCMNGERKLTDLLRRGVKFWTDWPYKNYKQALKAMGMQEEAMPTPREFEQLLMGQKIQLKHENGEVEEVTPSPATYATARQFDDMGPLYGYQWRHTSTYEQVGNVDGTPIYKKGEPIDQLASVVDRLKNFPNDRRMIVTSWNIAEVPNMVLPPCHAIAIHHYVADGKLNVDMTQRSCDMPVGVPFNIAFYSLYTMVLAKIAGLEPGELIWSGKNVHIYSNQLDKVKEQVTRTPRELPTVTFPDFTSLDDLKTAKVADFQLHGYNPHPKIKYEVAV